MGVLLRFRERPVAVTGDIREMFHQIKVSASDQSSQKFLWGNGEIDRPPDTYVMQMMTFGASCSPSLANFVLRRNAEQFGEKHPCAIKAIFRNTFVDDWLESVDTEDQMIELATNVKDIHTKGRFEMRNWLSNWKSVLQSLNNSREASPKYLGVEQELQEKVLGRWWLPESDMLTFVIRPELLQRSATHTKRRVLSIVMSIFDPLGILGFFNIRPKIILQNIWRSGVTWDDAIKEPDENDWMAWKALLIKLGDLRQRVPRMELMAAVLGLRLAKFLESELSIKIEKRIFWTDARDVLYWIKSDARKYPQFVALRIGEILEGSEIEDWRWVPSEQNVADEGTKWTKKCEINSSARWFTGPEFLLQGESQWPSRAGVDISSECELMYHDEETRVNKSPIDSIMPDLERMRAAQKRVLDFLRYICKEPRGPELVRLFKLKCYVEMDTVFLRACQEEAFADEIRSLKKGDCVTNRKSTILAHAGLREEVLRAALADAECTLNSRPLTYIPLESENSEALTPNHFLVSNSSGLRERGTMESTGLGLTKNFRIAGQLADRFWKRWVREYLPTLTRRTKWFQPNPKPIAVNDVVIVVDETSTRNSWPKGIVAEVHCGKDGQVRSAVVRTTEEFVTYPAIKLAKLNIVMDGNSQRSHAEELQGGECRDAGEGSLAALDAQEKAGINKSTTRQSHHPNRVFSSRLTAHSSRSRNTQPENPQADYRQSHRPNGVTSSRPTVHSSQCRITHHRVPSSASRLIFNEDRDTDLPATRVATKHHNNSNNTVFFPTGFSIS
ncbi:uncharacterized protein [Drosophila kikkawai]|uniref:DUF5641 domain-containing protein n=1 Tax=Drosophila kikkawai TaxID=30033 RepID=A0ABM4GGA7_DROKI